MYRMYRCIGCIGCIALERPETNGIRCIGMYIKSRPSPQCDDAPWRPLRSRGRGHVTRSLGTQATIVALPNTPPNNIPLLMGLTTCPLRRLLSGHHGASSHRGEGRDFCIHPIHRSHLAPQLSRAIHPIHLYILYIHTSYTLYIPIHPPSGRAAWPVPPFRPVGDMGTLGTPWVW